MFSIIAEMFRKFITSPYQTEDKLVLGYVVRRILKAFLIWSYGDRNFWFYFKLYLCYTHLTVTVSGIVGALYYFQTNYGLTLETIFEGTAGILLYVWGTSTMMFFSRKQKYYEEMYDDLADFSVYEKPEGIEKLNKKINTFFGLLILCMWASIFMATAYNLFIPCEDHVENICGMVAIYWLPFEDFYTRWNRRLGLLLQTSAVFMACGPSYFGGLSMLDIAEIINNRIDHLIRMIELIPRLDSREKRHVQVAKTVIYHQKILEITNKLTDHSYYYLLFHVPYTTFMVTFVTLQLMMRIKLLDLINVFLWLFFICLCCTFGERLLSKSLAIADACYLNMPFDADLITQKELMFIIATNKELCITAGMNEQCNNEKLVEVLKTCYSFITVLSSVGIKQ